MITKDMLNALFKPWNQEIEEDQITIRSDIKSELLSKDKDLKTEQTNSHMSTNGSQEKTDSTLPSTNSMHLRRQSPIATTTGSSSSDISNNNTSRKTYSNNNRSNNSSHYNRDHRERDRDNSKSSYGSHYHSKGNYSSSSRDSNGNNSSNNNNRDKRVAHPKLTEKARGTIGRDKIDKLYKLLNSNYEITSKDGNISFTISMFDYLKRLRKKLYERKVFIISMRLVGSGATYVVSDDDDSNQDINDLDFSMYICDSYRFLDILEVEEDILLDLLYLSHPDLVYSRRQIYDLFFLDSVKVDSNSNNGIRESWSLITIGKKSSQTIDIKFVNKSKRSYVFSSDSFEVVLDPFFPLPINNNNNNNNNNEVNSGESIPNSISKITVESIFGDFSSAIEHMRNNVLCTNNPEEIRRGIFRYSYELSKGKLPKDKKEGESLDTIFTAALFAEENMPFEDVLVKFLQKHPTNASLFLNELQNVLLRGSAHLSKDVADTEKYLSVILKHKELFPTSNKV